jgi:broad specificity phosphatase PhoE
MKLFLFRHTQTNNTLDGTFRYNGFIDVDVDDNGLKIFYKFIPILKKYKFASIYSSDLIRAKKGAQIFSEELNISYFTDIRLREVSQGRWEGLSYNEIIEKYPEEANKKFNNYVDYKVKGGENLIEAQNRVMDFINELKKKYFEKNILIVAHGGINTLILLNALNMDLNDFFRIKQDFGCLNIIEYFETFSKVIKMNYTILP